MKKRIKKEDNMYYPQYRKMILGFIPKWVYYSHRGIAHSFNYRNEAEHFLNSKH